MDLLSGMQWGIGRARSVVRRVRITGGETKENQGKGMACMQAVGVTRGCGVKWGWEKNPQSFGGA